MKTFKAGDELASLLIKQGLSETSTKEEKLAGRRTFKFSRQARKEIFFDIDAITLMEMPTFHDRRLELDIEELRICIFFLQLNDAHFKQLCPSSVFKINKVAEKLSIFEHELENNVKKARRNYIEKILGMFKDIKIEE